MMHIIVFTSILATVSNSDAVVEFWNFTDVNVQLMNEQTNSKVFIPHSMQSNVSFRKTVFEFIERHIQSKLHILGDLQLLSKGLQLSNASSVLFISASSNE